MLPATKRASLRRVRAAPAAARDGPIRAGRRALRGHSRARPSTRARLDPRTRASGGRRDPRGDPRCSLTAPARGERQALERRVDRSADPERRGARRPSEVAPSRSSGIRPAPSPGRAISRAMQRGGQRRAAPRRSGGARRARPLPISPASSAVGAARNAGITQHASPAATRPSTARARIDRAADARRRAAPRASHRRRARSRTSARGARASRARIPIRACARARVGHPGGARGRAGERGTFAPARLELAVHAPDLADRNARPALVRLHQVHVVPVETLRACSVATVTASSAPGAWARRSALLLGHGTADRRRRAPTGSPAASAAVRSPSADTARHAPRNRAARLEAERRAQPLDEHVGGSREAFRGGRRLEGARGDLPAARARSRNAAVDRLRDVAQERFERRARAVVPAERRTTRRGTAPPERQPRRIGNARRARAAARSARRRSGRAAHGHRSVVIPRHR